MRYVELRRCLVNGGMIETARSDVGRQWNETELAEAHRDASSLVRVRCFAVYAIGITMSSVTDTGWIAFSYSLPAKSGSSTRVTLWRQLRRLGAISPAGSLYLLPASSEAVEAFQWMTEEVRQAGGEALTLYVDHCEGLSDAQIIELFNAARNTDYVEVDEQATALELAIRSGAEPQDEDKLLDTLAKLRRRHAEIARVDYFGSPAGQALAVRLAHIEAELSPSEQASHTVASVSREQYHGRCWVTRPRPHVDRLACAWLISRFINPGAQIRYATTVEPGEVPFDMPDGGFGHQGNLCTFETMLLAFGLDDPALRGLAEIVHEIDLRDGRYLRPETAGIDAVLRGWQQAGLTDAELERNGNALFEALYGARLVSP
jgi:hypothetical protein